MSGFSIRYLLIGLALLATAGLSLALTPKEKISEQGPKFDLQTMIPKQFGKWQLDEMIVPITPDPEQKALLNKLYSQMLSRTYYNDKGERIMLSISYGGDQSRGLAVHKPEVCYPSQGFRLEKNVPGTLQTPNGTIPVKHLVAVLGSRIEPITYWITLGDEIPDNGIKWRLAQLKYGLTGKIPDGLLFRVSSIQADDNAAYADQAAFINDLLNALPVKDRVKLAGVLRR